jgi:ubiquinol-cytochrome c reductase cytochrome b subunit
MRDVNWGWLMRYAHANGASFFFVVIYIHIFRGFYYGSYKAPREMVWLLGVVIFLLMMATAFMGYVLPWGQMSFWGAKVITGLFRPIPLVGEPIQSGCSAATRPTTRRSTASSRCTILLPFVIAGVVILHIWALHIPGSSNPTGVEVKAKGHHAVPPFYTQGRLGLGVVLILSRLRVLHAERARPPGQLHPGQPAGDAGAHRARMVFLAVLRDPARLHRRLHPPGQAVGRAGDVRSILLWFFLPWLDKSPVRSGTIGRCSRSSSGS